MTPGPLPASFHVATPYGAVGLWWLDLPAQAHEAQRQWLRQQAAQILARSFPAASPAGICWPPATVQPAPMACAAPPTPPGNPPAPALWLSWSYGPPASPGGLPSQALLAIAPMPVGVDVSAGRLLPLAAWAEVLTLYGGAGQAPSDAPACARLWTGIEAAAKCLRTGLREWSPHVAAQYARCSGVDLPVPDGGCTARLAWSAPGAGCWTRRS